MGGRSDGRKCTVCRQPAKGHPGPMGGRCHTLNEGFEIEEPSYERPDNSVGIDLGHEVNDGGDRGGGGADEFNSPDDLGGTGYSVPPAQASSSGHPGWAADGDAYSSGNVTIPGSMGSRGYVRHGVLSPRSEPARSVPLHWQPSAQPGEHLRNFAPVNDPFNQWYYGPPLASQINRNLSRNDENFRPSRGPAGTAGRGIRSEVTPSLASNAKSNCQPRVNEASTLHGNDPSEGATSAPHHPREDATEASRPPDVST